MNYDTINNSMQEEILEIKSYIENYLEYNTNQINKDICITVVYFLE